MSIQVYDRQRGELIEEQVFGGAAVDWAYENPIGRALNGSAFLQRNASRLMGAWQDSPFSRRGVQPFIERFGVRMCDFAWPEGGFRSFDHFFTRRLAPGARHFPDDPVRMGAAAEGRLSVLPLTGPSSVLVVKGVPLSLEALVGDEELADSLVGGHAFVYRLCPVDYHRFHFPDDGVPGESRRIPGLLWSVNPTAHAHIPDVFLQNERRVCVFESENFGRLVLMEVGATMVGRIQQGYRPGEPVLRGQEKGWFAFGGSTTILLSGPASVRPDQDLLTRTEEGLESLVRVGEGVGRALAASGSA